MRRIRIPNPVLINNEKTYFDADYISGNALVVVSSFTFAVQDIVVAGNVGEKTTEGSYVTLTNSPLGLNIAPPFNFNHVKGTILYKSDWDSMSIEGHLPNQSFSVLKLLPIQWDKLQSIFIHTSGDDTWSYRFRLYNGILNIYSEYSPTQLGSGFTRQHVGQMILNTRKKVRDPNRQRFSDNDIIYLFQDANNTINAEIPKLWYLKVDTWETAIPNSIGGLSNPGVGVPSVGGQTRYNLNVFSNYDSLNSINYYYANNGAFLLYELGSLTDEDFSPYLFNQNRWKSDMVYKYKLLPPDQNSLQGYFEVNPVPLVSGAGIFYPVYWRKPNVLFDIMDVTECPFPEILEDYAAWKLHTYMGNDADAVTYKHLFYGPTSTGPSQHMTGIKLLQQYNNRIKRANSKGKSLWNYKGRHGGAHQFPQGMNHDFLKENYI